MSISGTYQHRRDTAANWTTANPVLMAGEIGLETDTLKLKAGDGTTAWASLSYVSGSAGSLLAANNLSDLANAATARTNLGLGTAATQATTAFDASGTASTLVSTHIATVNAHTQYLKITDAATTYAPLASPSLTGTPTAPTAAGGTNTTQLATTAFVATAVAGVTVPVTSVAGRTGAVTLTTADILSGTFADARLSSNVPLLNATTNTFTGIQSAAKVLIPPQVTGATNPLTIRANTGAAFTEPIFYVGLQGSETTSGIAVRSNGAIQLLGGAAIGPFNDIQIGSAGTASFGFARGTAQSFNLGGAGNFTLDAGSGAGNTSFDIYYSAKSSTTAGRAVARTLYSFATGTDSSRIGQVEEFIASFGGNARTSRRFGDGTNGYTAFAVSATAPADASLQNSELTFYTDGSGQLKVKLKDSGGTVRTGTVTLA